MGSVKNMKLRIYETSRETNEKLSLRTISDYLENGQLKLTGIFGYEKVEEDRGCFYIDAKASEQSYEKIVKTLHEDPVIGQIRISP